ncbi:unnamed protein product [Polarella glacialis]|uniref:Uncharacterized protein n=1 Tax=Polarella glacialis TaxID=89957 RepID=A0A813FNQ5_POLGL|nr:unnamed protein product [Polarella glacialis]
MSWRKLVSVWGIYTTKTKKSVSPIVQALLLRCGFQPDDIGVHGKQFSYVRSEGTRCDFRFFDQADCEVDGEGEPYRHAADSQTTTTTTTITSTTATTPTPTTTPTTTMTTSPIRFKPLHDFEEEFALSRWILVTGSARKAERCRDSLLLVSEFNSQGVTDAHEAGLEQVLRLLRTDKVFVEDEDLRPLLKGINHRCIILKTLKEALARRQVLESSIAEVILDFTVPNNNNDNINNNHNNHNNNIILS